MSSKILTVVAGACLAAISPAGLADVINLGSLNLVGTSQIISGGTLRLTPNFDTNTDSHGNPIGASPAGAAWTTSQSDVGGSWTANFDFQMSSPTGHLDNGHGGDGIAFVIQNSAAGDTALGLGAGGMGFMYIPDSLAIMLDTYQNSSPNYYGDPSNNYISVNTRGTEFNVPHHFCTNGVLTADASIGSDLPAPLDACTANPTPPGGMTNSLTVNMDDGKVHDLKLSYVPGTLDISLDNVLILSVAINLASTLDLTNGLAFLGFTAGTRFAYQNQDILDFNFAQVPEPIWGQLGLPLAMLLAIVLARKWRARRA